MAGKKTLSFEEALKNLEGIVQQLEQADVPLEEALIQFKKGMELSQYCKTTLEKAEKTVTKLMLDTQETVILEEAGNDE